MLEKYHAAQTRIFGWLEDNAACLDGPLNTGHLALACAVDYMERRGPAFDWRNAHPRLAAWYAEARARSSFDGTTAEANAERLGVSL